jgi:glycosyltransferase involved in cell wall biosynthesis
MIARLRVCIISDDLSGVADEGVKKYTVALAAALRADHEVAVISTTGPTAPDGVTVIPSRRSFVSAALRATLRTQRPDVIIYAARGSATFFSFLRARLLRAYCPGARIILLGLQTRQHSHLQQRLIGVLRPDLVGVGSAANASYLAGIGCRVALLPSGVDLRLFKPLAPEERLALRAAHGLQGDLPIVLHVGHLEAGRNVRHLATLAALGTCQVVLVTSSSTAAQAEQELGRELRAAGVRLITTYQPHIEELYQLADCYLFPTESTDNAIDAPLSVLEALACDLPVVTTPYGGLPGLFANRCDPALRFAENPVELIAAAAQVAQSGLRGGRSLVEPFGWGTIAGQLIAAVYAHDPARAAAVQINGGER